MIDVQQLLNIHDFNNLDEAALIEIATHAGQKAHKKHQQLHAEDVPDCEIYLLDGEIELVSEAGDNVRFNSDTERARQPIFRVQAPGLSGRCLTKCKVLYVNKRFFKKFNIDPGSHRDGNSDFAVAGEIGVEVLDTLSGVDMKIPFVSEVLGAFKGDKVQIPSLPEMALNIRSAIAQGDVGFKQLAGLLQTDPAIAARVVQVANSAMYGGGAQVDSIQKAITKIGLDAVNAIVTCVALRDLFHPKSALIKKTMAAFYEQSIRVGVICYDLAKRVRTMNPDHAFLAGLLHDIGAVPVLVVADNHAELSRQAGALEATLAQLKAHIGATLLKQWQFDKAYAFIAEHARHWQRQTDKPDYCDLVQVAILHAQFIGGPKCDAPVLSALPAFQRLGLARFDPAENIRLLNELSVRIKEMIKMLCK